MLEVNDAILSIFLDTVQAQIAEVNAERADQQAQVADVARRLADQQALDAEDARQEARRSLYFSQGADVGLDPNHVDAPWYPFVGQFCGPYLRDDDDPFFYL